MEPEDFQGSRMHKWLKPRYRQGQAFYSGVANLAWQSRKRPYYTPVLFLVIKHYAERFNLVEYINSKIEWDRSQWKISPGILALSLIYVCFLSEDGRIPLYKIPDHLRGLDLFLLFGQPLHPEDFTDDQYATLLERLGQMGNQEFLAGLINQVYNLFDMPRSLDLHSDTTSHIMYGSYPMCDIKGFEGLVITWGHSKDHLPNRKQTKTGLIVDGNGVIRFVRVLDGNESDSTWNTQAIKDLREKLGDDIDLYTYIADSKLVSLPNLREINNGQKTLKFISLVPSNFNVKMSAKVRKKAYDSDSWVDLGMCCENTKAKDRATYEISGFNEPIEGKAYRLLAVKSTSMMSDVDEKLECEKNDLVKLANSAFPDDFKCEPDAQAAIKKFQSTKKTSLFRLSFEIVPIMQEKKYRGKKPKIPRPIEMITVFKVMIREVIPDTDKIDQYRQREESFVLITNVPETELDDGEVLRKYKSQGIVERSFSRLKRPMMADTLFLKTPKRIEALMSLVYVALLFQSIMQAMARYRAAKMSNLPKIAYAKRKLENPTYDLMVHLFRSFEVVTTGESREMSCLVPEMDEYLNLILHLADAENC